MDFPVLEGTFEPAEFIEPRTQLTTDHAGQLQAVLAEEQLRKTHWRVKFRRVQYGTCNDKSACLLVIEGKFHPGDRKRHRFTSASISVELSSDDGNEEQVEVLRLAPERAYGITVPEQHSSNWVIKSKVSIGMPGSFGSIDILDARLGHKKQYPLERVASMQGSERGFPTAKEAFWTLEEAKQEGLPWRIPPMVILAELPQGTALSVRISIDAKIGFSLNPMRWPMMRVAPKPMRLDGHTELLLPEEQAVDRDFSRLDLNSLTKLDFSDDR